MQKMPVSEFKTHCLAVLSRLERTGQPLLLTRHGKPVAELRLPAPAQARAVFGSMKGLFAIVGDIVAPTGERWEAED
ncbi:MAG TPA: type II toxin-antitoxin system Phd/YefM family antitoxin [Candidatus Acidoferrum sp.]|nr:type II toxin-antitoxin system Phd/YefM family antitoxin [Candidatus Acidoferrum sp.]